MNTPSSNIISILAGTSIELDNPNQKLHQVFDLPADIAFQSNAMRQVNYVYWNLQAQIRPESFANEPMKKLQMKQRLEKAALAYKYIEPEMARERQAMLDQFPCVFSPQDQCVYFTHNTDPGKLYILQQIFAKSGLKAEEATMGARQVLRVRWDAMRQSMWEEHVPSAVKAKLGQQLKLIRQDIEQDNPEIIDTGKEGKGPGLVFRSHRPDVLDMQLHALGIETERDSTSVVRVRTNSLEAVLPFLPETTRNELQYKIDTYFWNGCAKRWDTPEAELVNDLRLIPLENVSAQLRDRILGSLERKGLETGIYNDKQGVAHVVVQEGRREMLVNLLDANAVEDITLAGLNAPETKVAQGGGLHGMVAAATLRGRALGGGGSSGNNSGGSSN